MFLHTEGSARPRNPLEQQSVDQQPRRTFMRLNHIVIVLAAISAASPAAAISRYNSQSMTCAEARQRVIDEGAVILRYPSTKVRGMTLYDRYVTRSAQCDSHEYAERAYVPTQDEPRCPVLSCEPVSPLPGQFFKPVVRF
jgi:hypothetical protein